MSTEAPLLPELPRPNCTYADHSYPAFKKAQMEAYATEAIRPYVEALQKIAALDYSSAAVNGCAHEAVQIAHKALSSSPASKESA